GAPDRPQMRPGVTYRSFTAAAQSPAGVGGDPVDSKEEPIPAHDPYSYDAPGPDGQPAGMGGSSGGSGGSPGINPPPPYSMQSSSSRPAPLPARTEGTYSSSYEHTAAWVQGNAPHASSDPGSGAGLHPPQPQQQQQQPQQQFSQPLSPHTQPQYVPPAHSVDPGQYVSQPPVPVGQYVSQAPPQPVYYPQQQQQPVQAAPYVSQPPTQ
ncbi:hypothetical protein IWQ57_003359, partial [Coemansia nantahalensis]